MENVPQIRAERGAKESKEGNTSPWLRRECGEHEPRSRNQKEVEEHEPQVVKEKWEHESQKNGEHEPRRLVQRNVVGRLIMHMGETNAVSRLEGRAVPGRQF